MYATDLLYLIIGLVLFDYVIDQSLSFLNYKSSKNEVPDKLKGLYNEEEYQKSQKYQSARTRFGFITSLFSTALTLVVLSFGLFGVVDGMVSSWVSDPIIQSLVYFGVLFLLSDMINLPFSYYSTFVIEEKFGFNKTTLKTFVLDKIKGYVLAIVMGGILGYALLWLINELGANFWIYALVLITSFMLFMNVFYTSLILPLFNKLTPLEDGELKSKIQKYAESVAFPLTSIYVIDGSKRSSKANAFFSGLGRKKKIVLYDTLINDHSEEELVAVLAHEVGHFKKKHIIQGLVLGVIQMAITLFILSLFIFNLDLSEALGADRLAIHINLIAFGILYSPISRLTGLLMNVLSRKNEFEADAFASTTYDAKPLMAALKKLSVSSLSNLTPHPAFVFMNYSHPPLLQRLNAMEAYLKN